MGREVGFYPIFSETHVASVGANFHHRLQVVPGDLGPFFEIKGAEFFADNEGEN